MLIVAATVDEPWVADTLCQLCNVQANKSDSPVFVKFTSFLYLTGSDDFLLDNMEPNFGPQSGGVYYLIHYKIQY